jgi:hypothetical protein
VTAAAALVWVAGCAANDPFDPESLENRRPLINFFVTQTDTTQPLNPTSYSTRTFRWSGTDPDGWVVEYYVAILTAPDAEAVWDTTTSTDTTLTFTPDDEGNADATFKLLCRDNRGALSDTLVRFIPMQNFPPVVEFQGDFDPLINMQREFLDAAGNVTEDANAAVDTLFWNWGASNFRFRAYDLDGQETLEPFFRYTMADDEPDSTYDEDDPRADPETSWVRVPFYGSEEVKEFTVYLRGTDPGMERTLSVSVRDTVGTGPIFKYTWEVRAPKGPVLYIPDISTPSTKQFYRDYFDGKYGPGNWDTYVFWKGFPDEEFTLLETMRKFDLVLWTDTGNKTNNIFTASRGGGVLDQYLVPLDDSDPGAVLMVSRILSGGDSGLTKPFRTNTLGISLGGLPQAPLFMPAGQQALGLASHLPAMTSLYDSAEGKGGLGLVLNDPDHPIAEFIFQMELCVVAANNTSCYCSGRRCDEVSEDLPADPYVGVRSPTRDVSRFAKIVGISIQLDEFDPGEVYPALDSVIEYELGVGIK